MGMSQSYGPSNESESIATIHRSIELGCTFLERGGYGNPRKDLLVRASKAAYA